MSAPSDRGRGIRRVHRWTAAVFTLSVLAYFVALAFTGGAQPHWAIVYAPLVPLLLLLLTGAYLFVLPYMQAARRAVGGQDVPASHA